MNGSAPAVLRFRENNRCGRDFVVGDLHGAFRVLDAALEQVRFDPMRDRLFSVGDLIDRGPESPRCLEFLRQPWFHAVRGNHEDDLLDLYAQGPVPEPALREAVHLAPYLAWWLDVPPAQRQEILTALQRLPLAIEVALSQGWAGIVHADIPPGIDWATFVGRLECGDRTTQAAALFGRTRIDRENDEGVPGIDRVFVGHTIQWHGMRCYGNVYAIDTGAVFSLLCTEDLANSVDDGCLTFVALDAGEEALRRPARAGSLDVRGVAMPCAGLEEQASGYEGPRPCV